MKSHSTTSNWTLVAFTLLEIPTQPCHGLSEGVG